MDSFTVTANVTQEDIDRGSHWDSIYCPLAQAVRRVLPTDCCELEPSISLTMAFLRDRYGVGLKSWYVATLPDAAQQFIERFDSKEVVKPESFQLLFRRQ